MVYIKWLLVLMLIVVVGCAESTQRSPKFIAYANTIPPIVVPPGIKNPTDEGYYPIPPVQYKAPYGTVPPLTPPGSQIK